MEGEREKAKRGTEGKWKRDSRGGKINLQLS